VALASHTQQPSQRLLVDEYSFNSSTSSYALTTASAELATYLHNKGLKIALVPDVKAAAVAAAAFWEAVASGKEDEEALACVRLPNSVAVALGLRSAQSSSSVLMVAPTAFGFNEEAAEDNSFMQAAQKPEKGSKLTEEVSLLVVGDCSRCLQAETRCATVAVLSLSLYAGHQLHVVRV
jgi:hypothetical protein